VFPKLVEKPVNVSVVAGKTFELHCQAQGHPEPVLSWQKDGGTSFPAADDRRMDFLPASKVYVIRNAQPGDAGKYTCSAKNEAGFVNATAFVTVLGKYEPSSLSGQSLSRCLTHEVTRSISTPTPPPLALNSLVPM